MGVERGGRRDGGAAVDAERPAPPSAGASPGAAMSPMAETIGNVVAWQRAEWENQRRRRGGQHGTASGSNGDTWLDMSPEAAVPIPDVQRPRRIAYVDGGNAALLGSPGWSAGFSRVAYAVCRGRTVHRPLYAQRVDFLSLLAAEPTNGGGGSDGDAGENGRGTRDHTPAGTHCAPSP